MWRGGEQDPSGDEEWLTAMVREAVGEVPRRLRAEVASWPAPCGAPLHEPCGCPEPDSADP
ncbi:hypothetical protein [Streptomyces massasporeus]|uniref:hypothetical protein n=1 Tax=Streptomyces massasporeus TaxID=67324 RepID=UPI0016795E07|nr:hypothetical protein [Streptomyces massasporeus]GGV85583.1 hypothetical protein GCM10010228_65200 [Streptomyces massasporeus]